MARRTTLAAMVLMMVVCGEPRTSLLLMKCVGTRRIVSERVLNLLHSTAFWPVPQRENPNRVDAECHAITGLSAPLSMAQA